jgi:hypothetical protein
MSESCVSARFTVRTKQTYRLASGSQVLCSGPYPFHETRSVVSQCSLRTPYTSSVLAVVVSMVLWAGKGFQSNHLDHVHNFSLSSLRPA